MSAFRYNTSGNWYKGNTHIHSTASDGGKDFNELADMYSKAGYDFLFRTDHWVMSDVSSDEQDYPLLWIDGVEIHGQDRGGSAYHVVCLGTFLNMSTEMGFIAGMEQARSQGGIIILAHPTWMGNSFEDALRWGFHGVEVYNHVCTWLNGKGNALAYFNAMLGRFPNTLAFSVDDAHIRDEHPGWNGGWIVVNAGSLTKDSIMSAIESGNFYSSQGPEIYSIQYDGTHFIAKTSPIQFARLVGSGTAGIRTGSFDGELITEVVYDMPKDWPYVYFEIEDNQGRRAWTNPLFIADNKN